MAVSTGVVGKRRDGSLEHYVPPGVVRLGSGGDGPQLIEAEDEADAVTQSAADPDNIYFWIE